jgi:hypothetical protein
VGKQNTPVTRPQLRRDFGQGSRCEGFWKSDALSFLAAKRARRHHVAAVYATAWEYSTRRYLKGFSDAIIPAAASPEEKIQAILDWMAHGPARLRSGFVSSGQDRDPTDTLNYDSLLRVCGTATNAFINLAVSGGLPARRILLLNSDQGAKHVDAEVLVKGRWIVVDPGSARFSEAGTAIL